MSGSPAIAPTAPATARAATAAPATTAAPTVLPATVVPSEAPTATQMATATAAPMPTATPTELPTATVVPSSTPLPPPTAPVVQTFSPELAAELQRILDQIVADGTTPGAVASVQIPGYAPWSGASGLADRMQKLPMTTDTRVRIASISKVYTAVVVLQLIEEGLIAIDAPLSAFFPGLVPNADQITVHHLLTHTTGLYDYVEDRNFINLGYSAPSRVWAPSEMVAYTNQFKPLFAPGTPGAWDYSSTNYVILGMIAEQVTGRTLGQEMRDRIFTPLGMSETYFDPEDVVEGPRARGYRGEADVFAISLSIVFATANIVSTTSDIVKFGQGIQNGLLLSPAMLELLYQFENGQGQYNMPELGYGHGIMRNQLYVGPDAYGQPQPKAASTVVGHIGGFGGFRSALWTAPVNGITIALGVNQGATDPNILATRVFDAVLRHQSKQ
ncbi:MAG: beta-lactamase family protein [Roseiflexaceae bacterium]|nr:beta-lactamase family protein [Roseiflexaceae bacterium]